MKKILLVGIFVLLTSACSRVDQGEAGIVTGFDGTISNDVRTSGFELVVLDSMEIVDLTQNIINLDNVTARDSDNIPLSELDAKITFNTNPDKLIEFYKKTRSISEFKDETGKTNRAVGYSIIKNEAINVLQKSIAKFKSKDITSNRQTIEQELKESLQKTLDERFGNVISIIDTNINTIKLDSGIERSLQLIQVTRNQQLEVQAQKDQVQMRKELLEAEMKAKAEVAGHYGISMKEYLELEIKRDFNKALEKSGSNVQLHLNK